MERITVKIKGMVRGELYKSTSGVWELVDYGNVIIPLPNPSNKVRSCKNKCILKCIKPTHPIWNIAGYHYTTNLDGFLHIFKAVHNGFIKALMKWKEINKGI